MSLSFKGLYQMENEEVIAFILRVLKALQQQIDVLQEHLVEQEIRTRNIEDQIRWNVMYGDFLSPPQNEMIVRLANGCLALNLNENGEIITEEDLVGEVLTEEDLDNDTTD